MNIVRIPIYDDWINIHIQCVNGELYQICSYLFIYLFVSLTDMHMQIDK